MKLKMEIKIGTYIQSNTKNKLKPCIFTFYKTWFCVKQNAYSKREEISNCILIMEGMNQILWYRALIMSEYVSFLETREEKIWYDTCLYNAMIWGKKVK